MSMTGRYLHLPLSIVDQIRETPSMLLGVLYPEDDTAEFRLRLADIDKNWHVIHFLLNGSAWDGTSPLFDAVLGGVEFTEDLGHGPARFLLPEQVVATSKALAEVEPEELWRRFDPTRLKAAEVYGAGGGADSREYVLESYAVLRAFFRAASAAGDAAILWLA
jgi:hypothetical protein